ncbi:uncharacterized protein K452DRAFT_329404 [Aplosporella prunicola CBS 121167]|uniref:Enoyl reductase (ER) domain-containing protein n=1 Tax=Aplosporella prunicola CBS 121167 TaxID=1176127 RepID=A0A6A6B0J8_9PEZI|nr:uncharacterized protein K452DRAFT_329404 [Aplosporella prunicola CBS 121167]KAF2137078.1 hypothetical protein K452DRAFT_329404 [Aplosporella prunicola CBS 121167]
MALNATNTTMRGVVWDGTPYSMSVTNLPIPTLQSATDVIVRMTAAGICGTDLHTYHGIYGSAAVPYVMGHEGMGIITEVGAAVQSLAVGEYVVIPDKGADGHLHLDLVPDPGAGTVFGLGEDFGLSEGCQAEYLRVPFADDSLFRIPNATAATPATALLSYLFVGDIFATAWAALDFSGFEPGDTVVVFGAGPVGLLAAYSAQLRGASRVYAVDRVPARLRLAASIGAVPINFAHADPVAQILAREPGGVARAVDCVGYEAVDSNGTRRPHIVLSDMVRVAAAGGGLGQIGVFFAAESASAGIPFAEQTSATVQFPIVEFFNKGLSLKSGPVDPKIWAPRLMELVAEGRAQLDFIVSFVVGIEEAPEAYRRFERREESKAVIIF